MEGELTLWQAASDYLYKFLQFLYGIIGNWGLTIIALTVIVRVILHPLNSKQMRSMQQMQRLQPRLKVLQEKYANDKEALSRETMTLYKENNVNPASGCLPLLIQLPILILLFNVLRKTSFGGASFIGIPLEGTVLSTIAKCVGFTKEGSAMSYGLVEVGRAAAANPSGLANVAYLPILILLLAIVGLTWYQQRISSRGNPQMAMMNIFMPIFMGFICLSMPGGLLIYWSMSSLFAVGQQIYSVRSVAKEEKPTLYKEKPREGEYTKKASFSPKSGKTEPKAKPAPKAKKDKYDIPTSSATIGEYDDFDSFIPRKRRK